MKSSWRIWGSKMKIECSRQLCAERTVRQTDGQSDSLRSCWSQKLQVWMLLFRRPVYLNPRLWPKLTLSDHLAHWGSGLDQWMTDLESQSHYYAIPQHMYWINNNSGVLRIKIKPLLHLEFRQPACASVIYSSLKTFKICKNYSLCLFDYDSKYLDT